MRTRQKEQKLPQRYDGRWRNRDPSEAPKNSPYVVRLKARQTGETLVKDVVLGEVRFANDQLDDMVLLRSDGTPTYMLAVVVDDHDMGVTHVIRGADHLNNAARQLQIIEQMDWQIPIYAHVPLIHGPDGAKLSKRHGALSIEAYRDMGYLPETMRNYLLRLGWSHGDDEIISTKQAIEWFQLENIGKSPARMDFKKLDSLNGHYIRQSSDEALTAEILAVLARESPPRVIDMNARRRVVTAMPGLKERAKTLVELVQAADFLYSNGAQPLDQAAQKLLTSEARAILAKILTLLKSTEWSESKLEQAVRGFADSEGLRLGQVAQPLRAALTGKSTSPPLFEIMVLLGREESLVRLGAWAA